MSETIGKLAMALVKFNCEVETIAKDAKNPHFKNNYATLDNIVEVIRPLLAKQGVIVMQIPGGDGENVIMKTMLLHESGEFMKSEALIMRPAKNDPQGVGSCITYARRYSLCSMLSLSTGEDDDGNHASQPQRAAQPPQSAPQRSQSSTPPPPSDPTQSKSTYTPPHSYKRDAYSLREQLFMTWNDLQSFAERVLDRKVGKVTAIQDEKDWEIIVRELNTFQSQPSAAMEV
jgi:hypothetical protein